MKIGSIDNKPLAPVTGERNAPTAAPAAKPEKTATPEASAQVTLSSTAKSLGDGNAEFDAAKVERVSNAIRDGKYQVNAEAIADKLISNAQELLSRGSH
ncbi:MAG: flagellar biosynthesis anti-sigma factor FlgM [Aquincola sp.]|uniref:flagellar biosynthesis anti-sigma factor FlgM n=1 Tax=uncultured Aquincola sp. TaxID=886556 RepID=UPI0032B1BD7F|nr:flagellar biosynthesis anti-sigma factor FlgM [Aquincola sp.]|tara:strand:+ start:1151 stop:1447 length:297 start_codon:yes stop_codon:yes gene_type:complete